MNDKSVYVISTYPGLWDLHWSHWPDMFEVELFNDEEYGKTNTYFLTYQFWLAGEYYSRQMNLMYVKLK